MRRDYENELIGYTNNPLDCTVCEGRRWMFDTHGTVKQCPRCRGTGKEPRNPEQGKEVSDEMQRMQ